MWEISDPVCGMLSTAETAITNTYDVQCIIDVINPVSLHTQLQIFLCKFYIEEFLLWVHTVLFLKGNI